jgi:hypothetical protein
MPEKTASSGGLRKLPTKLTAGVTACLCPKKKKDLFAYTFTL